LKHVEQLEEYEGHRAINGCGCGGAYICAKCYGHFKTVTEFNEHITEVKTAPRGCGCRRK